MAALPMRRIFAFVYIINARAASSGEYRKNRQYSRSHDVHDGAATTASELRAVLDPSQSRVRVEAQ